jgi:hypothetical protein
MKTSTLPPWFDTLQISLSLCDKTPRALAFSARGTREAQVWQKRLRAEVVRLLGGFPKPVPLAAQIVEKRSFPSYRRHSVVFTSRPGVKVFCYYLLPTDWKEGAARLPCVVCLPGHGRGVDSLVGLDGHGQMRPWGKWGEYQKDFALQCVSRGYAVCAVEQIGFGRRRDPAAVRRGPRHSSCQPAAGAALLLGQTMTGWRVGDAMRAVDWLETQPEVDPTRIAVMGISGGGTTALFTAAVDPRIKAAVVSGYFNSFRASVASIVHCMDNYVPGMLRVAEMSDIAGLIAPRGLFVESGTRDPIFPVEATRQAYSAARKIYSVLGAESRLGMEVFPGNHRFWGRGAFQFLQREL